MSRNTENSKLFVVRPDGSIEAPTAEGAVRIARLLAGGALEGGLNGAPRRRPAPKADVGMDRLRTFLKGLDHAGESGMSRDAVAKQLGVQSGKAMGPVFSQMKVKLKKLGFKAQDVYDAQPDPEGGGTRLLRATKLKAALEAAERA